MDRPTNRTLAVIRARRLVRVDPLVSSDLFLAAPRWYARYFALIAARNGRDYSMPERGLASTDVGMSLEFVSEYQSEYRLEFARLMGDQ